MFPEEGAPRLKVLITGGNGCIGSALSKVLVGMGHNVRASIRKKISSTGLLPEAIETVAVGDLGPNTEWQAALRGAELVFHCAARAHILLEKSPHPLAAYREANTEGTRRLAAQAAAAGVKRLVFLSSVGVLGRQTLPGKMFTAEDTPCPSEPYAVSKWEAEEALKGISEKTGLEIVVVRSPLVYGPGAKGNFPRLVNLILSGFPIPLGAICNRRSLVGLGNLVDFLVACGLRNQAAGQTFLVRDGQDLSTPELLKKIAKAWRVPLRLWPLPVRMLSIVGWLAGKKAEMDRLTESLSVDDSSTRRTLGWDPPFSIEEELQNAARWWQAMARPTSQGPFFSFSTIRGRGSC